MFYSFFLLTTSFLIRPSLNKCGTFHPVLRNVKEKPAEEIASAGPSDSQRVKGLPSHTVWRPGEDSPRRHVHRRGMSALFDPGAL
jgi:hypothetical protein